MSELRQRPVPEMALGNARVRVLAVAGILALAATIAGLFVARERSAAPSRTRVVYDNHAVDGSALLALSAGPIVTVRPGGVGFPVPGVYSVRALLASEAAGGRFVVVVRSGSLRGPRVTVASRRYRWYDLGRFRLQRTSLTVDLDRASGTGAGGLLVARIGFARSGAMGEAIVFDPRAGETPAALAMGIGPALEISPGAEAYPRPGAYIVRARLASARSGGRYAVKAGPAGRLGPDVVVKSSRYRWYDLGWFDAVAHRPFVLRVDSVVRVRGPGILIGGVEFRRVPTHTRGVYSVVGAIEGSRSSGEIVSDPQSSGGSALLATATGAIVVVTPRAPVYPTPGVYRVFGRVGTAAAGARYAVSAASGGNSGPQAVVSSHVYRWYDLGWLRMSRGPFVLRLDDVLRPTGRGLLVDRVELRRATLSAHGVYEIIGALDGNRAAGHVLLDRRALSGSALLATSTGRIVAIGPGAPAYPVRGAYAVRARLATAAPGARYRLRAEFGRRVGREVTVASSRYRWYDLGRLRGTGGAAFVLRLDKVVRSLGPGLLVDRVELRRR